MRRPSSCTPPRGVGLCLFLTAVLTILVGCSTGPDAVDAANGGEFRFVAATPGGEVIAAGERASAPTFTGELLDGSDFDSAELAGDVIVLNFWGSWCAPCRLESPEFQDVYAEQVDTDDPGVSFVGINVKDSRSLAQQFLADKGIEFPSVFDPRGEVGLIFRDFPATAIPSTIVIDPAGDVAAVYVGAVSADELRRVLDTVLAE